MSDNLFTRSTLAILFLVTFMVVVNSIQQLTLVTLSDSLVNLGVYGLLTTFALALSVPIAQGRGHFSMAHAIGITAFLSSDVAAVPAMTLSIFLGGVIGAIMLLLRLRRTARNDEFRLGSVSMVVSGVTLPFAFAGQYYLPLGLSLPVGAISGADAIDQMISLTIYAIIYVMIYFVIFSLQFVGNTREERLELNAGLRAARTPLISLLLLPIPFAFLFAQVAHPDESFFSFVTGSVGSLLVFFGIFALSETQTRLHQQLVEVRSISDATRALRSDLGSDMLLQTVADQVRQLLKAEHFTVALKSNSSADVEYPLVIQRGEVQVPPISLSTFDEALIRRIMRTGEPLFYRNNVAKRAGAYGVMLKDERVTSWLAVPLVLSSTPFGVFVVQSDTGLHFDEADMRVLSILAASTSIALENARLYHQKSESAEQLATLNQVMELLTETLSPNDVLDTVVSSASTISEAHAVSVYLYESDSDAEDGTQVVQLARSAGLSTIFEHEAMRPMMARYTIKNSPQYLYPGSFVVSNVQESTELDSVTRRLLIQEGKLAIAEIPLVRGQTNIGILVLYFDNPQTFQDEQIDLWQAFATQAAQAIDNARTFTTTDQALEQRVEQLYALATMGRLLNAQMETARIFQIVLDYAQDATHATRGVIVIRDENDNLHVPAQIGYRADLFHDPSILQQGLTGRVLRTGQALRTEDVRTETGYLPFDTKTRSSLIVPIMKRDRANGLILLESDQLAQFSDSDSHYVAQIANQAVIAVDNTRLFQRIREARDNLKVILDAMEEGIILIGANMHVALANPRVDLIEIAPDDILNQPIQTLLDHPDLDFSRRLGFATRAALVQLLRDLQQRQRPTNIGVHDYEVMHNGQIRYIQRQIIPVNDDESQVMGLLLVFYNKTEERELARAQEMLSQMIVHDLRSPLTAVTTSLSLLDALIPEESPHRDIVDKTTQSSRRAIRKVLSRVDSLLDISKMESGEMQLAYETVAILHLAKNVQTELAPLAHELEVNIAIDIEPTLPFIHVDSDKIERTLLNLVDNALKYSPSQGKVTISAMVEDAAYLRVMVTDEGPGIPDDFKQRLFDRFVQVSGRKAIRRGVGLGLTFCKLAVEAHGGRIWVEDNIGGGSQFIITLPLAEHPTLID